MGLMRLMGRMNGDSSAQRVSRAFGTRFPAIYPFFVFRRAISGHGLRMTSGTGVKLALESFDHCF